jgi:Predicted aspartyl protease
MKFPYSTVIVAGSGNGHFLALRRPEIQASVIGPAGKMGVTALVDTGSDQTIFPKSVADRLQIAVTQSEEFPAAAFTGERIELLSGEVELEVINDGRRLAWRTVVWFYDAPDTDKESVVFGHAGFLDYFTATFDGLNAILTLEPNAELPAVVEGG